MSKDLVKKHSEGITHNTIGSIISTYLIQGTLAVIGLSTALLAYLRNGVPLYLVILIGSAIFFLLSFTWYYVAQRRRLGAANEELSNEHLTGGQQLVELSDGNLVLGVGAVDNSVDKRIETLNGQIISLNEEIGTLKDQHAEEIDGRRRAFEALRMKHDTLQERVEGWEKYTWLVGIAETQAEHIDQYVILDRIERGDIQLNDGVPFVKFGIWIANKLPLRRHPRTRKRRVRRLQGAEAGLPGERRFEQLREHGATAGGAHWLSHRATPEQGGGALYLFIRGERRRDFLPRHAEADNQG